MCQTVLQAMSTGLKGNHLVLGTEGIGGCSDKGDVEDAAGVRNFRRPMWLDLWVNPPLGLNALFSFIETCIDLLLGLGGPETHAVYVHGMVHTQDDPHDTLTNAVAPVPNGR
jgi:hypothetical protein